MTSLTEQCLASINRINTLYGESNRSVAKTIEEFCDKCDIMLSLSNNEIVLENWWEKKPDESKITSFFLFIPRLFHQIFQYLKDIFEKIRYKLMSPMQKELWDMLKTTNAERFNQYVEDTEHIRGFAVDKHNYGFQISVYYLTRLRSASVVMQYLDTSRGIFQALADVLKNQYMEPNQFNTLSTELLKLNTSDFSEMLAPAPEWMSEAELFGDVPGFDPFNQEAFRFYLKGLSDKVTAARKEVDSILTNAGPIKDAESAVTGYGVSPSTHNDIDYMQIQNHFRDMQKNFVELGKEIDFLFGLNRKKMYAFEKLAEDEVKTELTAKGALKF